MALAYIPAPNKTEKKENKQTLSLLIFIHFITNVGQAIINTWKEHCSESSGENGMELYKRQKTRGNMEKLELQERMNQGINSILSS